MPTLKIKNWSIYQHYKDRNPPWIKLSTSLFQDYEFSCLQDASKLLAICIWTLGARQKDGSVPYDFDWIKQQCGLGESVTIENLNELILKGYLVPDGDASKMLASCKQNASPETERETKRDITPPISPPDGLDASQKDSLVKKMPRVEKPDDVTESTWLDFIRHRAGKKAPVTETALQGIRREAERAGWAMEDALREVCSRGWQGFKAAWVNKEGQNEHGKQTKAERARVALDEGERRAREIFGEQGAAVAIADRTKL